MKGEDVVGYGGADCGNGDDLDVQYDDTVDDCLNGRMLLIAIHNDVAKV